MNEREPVPASRGNFRNNEQPPTLITIVHECLKLADLQLQLFQMDIVEFWKRSQLALGLFSLGSALLLGSLPIALMAIAAWLKTTVGLSQEASLACTAAMGVIIAVTTLAWAVMRLQRAIEPLASNQEEFRANLQWMRHLLHQDESNDSTGP
ncbi:phage holin family protein [Planctopirus limnophila]|nr:phage holin family protein [Planctopirus limnophila]